jgi:ABC-type oligopeptide transport system substrate-binding subunit
VHHFSGEYDKTIKFANSEERTKKMKRRTFFCALHTLALTLALLAGCSSSQAAQNSDGSASDHVFTVACSSDIGEELNPHLYHSGAALYALNYV